MRRGPAGDHGRQSIGMTLAEVKTDLEKRGYSVPVETTLLKYCEGDMENGVLSASQKEKAAVSNLLSLRF